MRIKKHLKYGLLVIALLIPFTVVNAADCNVRNDWTRTSPKGYAFSECRNGLGFPAFNAYRNATMLTVEGVTLTDDEFDFAQVRRIQRNGTIADQRNELGYRNEVSISDGEIADALLYIHNVGNPTKNFVNSDGSLPRDSVVARNTRMRVDGFQNIGGRLISNQGSRHVFNAYLSSPDATPTQITDNFVVNVPNGKALELIATNSSGASAGEIDYCIDGRDHDCATTFKPFSPANLVDSDGQLLSSYFRGSGGRDGYFFGSQGYRQIMYFGMRVIDAPVQECRSLVLTPRNNPTRVGDQVIFDVTVFPENREREVIFTLSGPGAKTETTIGTNRTAYISGWDETTTLVAQVPGTDCRAPFNFRDFNIRSTCDDLDIFPTTPIRSLTVGQTTNLGVDVEPESFRNSIRLRHSGSGTSELRSGNSFIRVSGWDRSTRVEAYVPGHETDCADPQTFRDGITEQTCENLELVYDRAEYDRIPETGRLEITAEVTPSDLEATIIWNVTNGTLERTSISGRTVVVTGISEDTVVTARVEGSDNPDCSKPLRFDDIGPRFCEFLNMSPDEYEYDGSGSREVFNVTETTPTGFEGPFKFETKDPETGVVFDVQEGASRRYVSPVLDGSQVVTVDVPNAKEATPDICSDIATSSKPPIGEICPGLEIKRASRLTHGYRRAYCSQQDPMKLVLDGYGEYEGEVIWRAVDRYGNPNPNVSFTDGTQRREGIMRTHISNAVVVGVCDPGTEILVHLDDPDVYGAEICKDRIPSLDQPGDKPAEITKSVDRKYVNNEEVVTYTVRYTPLLGFFDDQFNTTVLFDTIATGVFGVNDEIETLGQLIPIRGSLRVNVPFVPGTNILDPAGLEIPNVDVIARNNGTIEVTYQARVNSALNEQICSQLVNNCGENYLNTASDDLGLTASQEVIATCPFILSRGFGDVFLEEDFSRGIDIARCSARTSAEGPVFTPDAPDENTINSTGTEVIVEASHEICDQSSKFGGFSEDQPEQFRNVLRNFSSSVCESAVQQAEKYTVEASKESLLASIARVSRGNTMLNGRSSISTLQESQLDNLGYNPNPKNKVYRKTDGDLSIGSGGTLKVDGQAKTIIVEGHDLYINSNIEYASGDSMIAFVVIGGDIYIDPAVSETVGILATVKKDGRGGEIKRTSPSGLIFVHTGSVFGDIEPLFLGQTVSGDLSRDRGAVTVRYDGRIVGNTPPGLEAVVQFNQFQTATGNSIYE